MHSQSVCPSSGIRARTTSWKSQRCVQLVSSGQRSSKASAQRIRNPWHFVPTPRPPAGPSPNRIHSTTSAVPVWKLCLQLSVTPSPCIPTHSTKQSLCRPTSLLVWLVTPSFTSRMKPKSARSSIHGAAPTMWNTSPTRSSNVHGHTFRKSKHWAACPRLSPPAFRRCVSKNAPLVVRQISTPAVKPLSA